MIGPTTLQGIEVAHGWNPNLPYGTDTATTYQVNGNRVVGNWVGFRVDGSYDPAYRSGYNPSNSDNGNGINLYDGTNDNVIARNYVAAVYDGIQVMSSNSQGNIVRGNVIGESPLGEAAPLTGWGIVVRWGTRFDQLLNNTIRRAEQGRRGAARTSPTTARRSPSPTTSGSPTRSSSGPTVRRSCSPQRPGDPDRTANDTTHPPVITAATTEAVARDGHPRCHGGGLPGQPRSGREGTAGRAPRRRPGRGRRGLEPGGERARRRRGRDGAPDPGG